MMGLACHSRHSPELVKGFPNSLSKIDQSLELLPDSVLDLRDIISVNNRLSLQSFVVVITKSCNFHLINPLLFDNLCSGAPGASFGHFIPALL